MKLATHRAAPTAKARLPFIRPRGQAWRSGQPRVRAIALLGAGLASAMAGAVGWSWRRRSETSASPFAYPPGTAGAAVATARSAIVGYRRAPEPERAAFNLLTALASAIGISRCVTYWHDQRQSLRSLRGAWRSHRVHHYLPGIALAFAAGGAATLVREGRTRSLLAAPLGFGVGVTLDEVALLLEREDLYWENEQLPLLEAGAASIASVALTARFMRRGEALPAPRGSSGGA